MYHLIRTKTYNHLKEIGRIPNTPEEIQGLGRAIAGCFEELEFSYKIISAPLSETDRANRVFPSITVQFPLSAINISGVVDD